MRSTIVRTWNRLVDDCRNSTPLRFREILSAALKALLLGTGVAAVMALAIIATWLFPKPDYMHLALYLSLVGIGFTAGTAIIMVAGYWVKDRLPGFLRRFAAMMPWTRRVEDRPE